MIDKIKRESIVCLFVIEKNSSLKGKRWREGEKKNGIINFNLDQQEYIEEKKQIKFYNDWKENEKKNSSIIIKNKSHYLTKKTIQKETIYETTKVTQ